MKIDGRLIRSNHPLAPLAPPPPPYIIAEISGNHGGMQGNALRLISAAKRAGADAVKFQAYTADTITLDCNKPDFIMKDGPWAGRKLHELYKKAQTPFSWFPSLFDKARKDGITPFASVFDRLSVDVLEKLDCPAYKIASFEITDLPLIQYAGDTWKPLIVSTGMAANGEISAARSSIKGECEFLHCISGYPTPIEQANLGRMGQLAAQYGSAGISDHTLGWEIPVAATVMGATIIEKHLCLSRDDDTEDASFSLTPPEFKHMVDTVHSVWQAMQPSEAVSQEANRQARRSLYVVRDMNQGDVFTDKTVRSIRPGYGLLPAMLSTVIGKRAAVAIERGTALTMDMFR